MYSFDQRPDVHVIDEPLYGHYLRVSGAIHPGGDEVMAHQDTNGDHVIQEIVLAEYDEPYSFTKHMAHHLVDLDLGFLDQTVNILLVRDPFQMLPSLINQIPEPTLRDTGLARQCDLLDDLIDRGQQPAVLDAKALLQDPGNVLRQLCDHLGLPFDANMLAWPAGKREADGVWAKHWYQSVHTSTGFMAYREKTAPFPAFLEPLLAECAPYYERLWDRAIKPA